MKYVLFIILFILGYNLGTSQRDIDELDPDVIEGFKAEMELYQLYFNEGVLNLINSRNQEDLFIAKSFFVSLFPLTNSRINDIIEGIDITSYTPYTYRETIVETELNSPIFNKTFKNDTAFHIEKSPTRVTDGVYNYSFYKGSLFYYEKLSFSKPIEESRYNDPTFNAYKKGILKKMNFEIEIVSDFEYRVRISGVDVIRKNHKDYDKIVESIEDNDNLWSHEALEEMVVNNPPDLEEDISILHVDPIHKPDKVYLEAYPTGGDWSGKGIAPNSNIFDPLEAYNVRSGGDQTVTVSYSFTYKDGRAMSKDIKLHLSSSLIPEDMVEEDKEITSFNPNLIATSDLVKMGVSDKTAKRIDKYRSKCKWIKKPYQFNNLLRPEDEIYIDSTLFTYEDLEQDLRNLLTYERPVFPNQFDPNNLDSAKLSDIGVDPYTITEFNKYVSSEGIIRSRKKLKKIGCFDDYAFEIRGRIKFENKHRTSPEITRTDYIPGFGHYKFKSYKTGSNLGRNFRTISYTVGFWGATTYATINGINSYRKYRLHKSAETFRSAKTELDKANTRLRRTIIGSVAATAIFAGNIIHLKILECKHRKSMESDDQPRFINVTPSLGGINITYDF